MVNFGFNSASILGIFLAVAGAGLYFMRSLRPELSRDHDIFFAAVGLLCGGILLWHGWRLDPILQFSQLLLAGAAIFFAAETIRLRGVATEQARRNSTIVDDERPVSRVYRAELAQIDQYEEDESENRRLQGSRDRISPRRSVYEEEPPRSRRARRTSTRYTDEPPARTARAKTPPRSRYGEWEETPDHWDDTPPAPRRRSREPRVSYAEEGPPPPSRRSQKRRPKSPEEIASSAGTEYVDYQPIEEEEVKPRKPESEPENEAKSPPQANNSPHFDY